MLTLFIALAAGIFYLIAYHTHGQWLSRKIFKLDPAANVPSVEFNDDQDYVPTAKSIVFGHHFTSIAGTGPIVGPAIAVMWGWLPALLWVLLGSVFIGAVHDFGALIVSLRNRGQTVGDIAGRVLNTRVRIIFLLVLFMALTIVLAIFGLVIAVVFKHYPSAIIPCVLQIPLAIAIGALVHRQGRGLLLPSLLTLLLMYVGVAFGNWGPLGNLNAWMASQSVIVWVVVLLVYSYIASVLPVWVLLQPRDYINSLQLISALSLVMVGLAVASIFGGAPLTEGAARPELAIVAPIVEMSPQGAPLLFPFLFVTIACGAISGFHCLVSSGTSSKQLKCETDAQFVGYGSMLTEGYLATLVILACVAGLGLGVIGEEGPLLGKDAWADRYASWSAAKGLPAKVGAFVDGSANFLQAMGLPVRIAIALMGVLVASFAATTLDTSCRLQRYVIQELAGSFVRKDAQGRIPLSSNPFSWLVNTHGATLFAITLAATMAALPVPGSAWSLENAGQGGMILWPLFGATNQLLGGLAFMVIAFWMWRRGIPVWFVIIPMVFMLIMPAWAMLHQLCIKGIGQETSWLGAEKRNWPLIIIAMATIVLEIWMMIEAIIVWPKAKGVLESHGSQLV